VSRRTRVPLAAAALLLLTGCSAAAPGSGPTPSPSPAPATASGTVTAAPDPAEPGPTTTNTLPPPPAPSAPAPSTAGDLTADALPVPAGWRTVALAGGTEEGFEGNGSWVHARDPRYAAQDVITIGCADVTRDDYPDPVAALEGNYTDEDGAPGVGLVLDFADAASAEAYWARYRAQVEACRTLDEPVRTELVEGLPGLVDRRTYPDGTWTEVGRRSGTRVTLVILADGDRALTREQARALLEQLA
jgi:hypothetical protein